MSNLYWQIKSALKGARGLALDHDDTALDRDAEQQRLRADAAEERLMKECESHEETVADLQSEHAETYGAFNEAMAERDAALARIAVLEKALDRLRLWGEGLPDHGYPPVTGEGWDLLRDIIGAARSALEASAVPSEPYMNDYVLDERNRPASAVPSETWGERHHQWHSGGDCGCSWAETLDRRTLPASAVPSEPMPGRRGPDHGPGCDCMAHDLPASAVPSETRDRDYGHRPTRTWPGLTLNGRVVCAADAMKWPCPSYRALHGFERGR